MEYLENDKLREGNILVIDKKIVMVKVGEESSR